MIAGMVSIGNYSGLPFDVQRALEAAALHRERLYRDLGWAVASTTWWDLHARIEKVEKAVNLLIEASR